MKMILLIRSLERGGAERQLVILAKSLHELGYNVRVVTFYAGGALRPELEAAGVPHSDLGKYGRWDVLGFLFRLVTLLRREKPALLYSFLPMANVWGLVAGRLGGVKKIVWGVRTSHMDLWQYDWMARLESRLAIYLSRYADRIICNSYVGADYHRELGYPPEKLITIHNGIHTDRFYFEASGRHRLREEWGVGTGDQVIGIVARLDPVKDHATALRAFAEIQNEWPNAKLACIGSGSLLGTLKKLCMDLGISERLIWAGELQDMAAAYSAVDLVCSCSSGEGFSNTIAEAMACQRLCIVTDVGDSARITGETGWIVPAGDHRALADAWRQALSLPIAERQIRELEARAWIADHYSVGSMVTQTIKALEDQYPDR